MGQRTLGLDLGPNSIGWALVEQGEGGVGSLVDCGVRVFPEGVDAFDTGKESSRNEQRRDARMMRRQIRRRARRKKIVEAALVEAKLLPADAAERKRLLAGEPGHAPLDPIALRARAATEPLQPFELGRIIYHLNQRRGFLSLKKVSRKTIEKELKAMEKKKAKAVETGAVDAADAIKKQDDSKMLAAIELLAQRIGARTLGETLHAEQHAEGLARTMLLRPGFPKKTAPRDVPGDIIPVPIRNQHTRRSMLEDEFIRIWEAQNAHHPELLTESTCFGEIGRLDAQRTRKGVARNWYGDPPRRSESKEQRIVKIARAGLKQFGLHGLIFHQRPIYWPDEIIGLCELENGCRFGANGKRLKPERRCHRADRRAQRFRMLQEINNLRFTPSGVFEERSLDEKQRANLLQKLYTTERLTFVQIRDLLHLDGASFNLERGERSSMKGCETDVRIAREFKGWHKLDEASRNDIVRVLIDAERDMAAARDKLLSESKLSEDVADALLSVDLPDGYVRFSLKAIEKLMPHLERGLILVGRTDAEASAMHAAGYLRRDELQRRLFDKLPTLATIRSGPLADLPNPVVRATMHELRRVVNAIVREYGRPDAVHIEMARSLKMSGKQRKEYNRKINERGEERSQIARILRGEEEGTDCDGHSVPSSVRIAPTRDAILKYRLWQEQKCRCVYTGRQIGFAQLYDGSTDIDHILPYSVTLDDSQMNKVVCFRDANHEKGQRSPYQWLAGSDPERLKRIEQWGACLPYSKRRRLSQQEIKTDDFIARQLVDTGYIAKLAVTYLEMLVQRKHDVQGRKGTYTADLRWHWGLGDVIESLPDSPAWEEKNNLSPGEKNRADHRHHALDAIVIALTSCKTLAALHQGKEMVNHIDRETGEIVEYQRFTKDVPPPWGMDREAFRQMVMEKLRSINVSRRARRRIFGAFHEDTNYGPVWALTCDGERQRVEGKFVVRELLENLSVRVKRGKPDVLLIRDDVIRAIVLERLQLHEIDPCAKGEDLRLKEKQTVFQGLQMPSGVPIRRVRFYKEDKTIRRVGEQTAQERWVKPGSTHHLCIFEWDECDGKGRRKQMRDAVFVSMMEANRRSKAGEPIIQQAHPQQPAARFVMSLCGGETLLVATKEGMEPMLLMYKTAASTTKQMKFARVTDARRSADQTEITFKPTTFPANARKVIVDPLGRVRWADAWTNPPPSSIGTHPRIAEIAKRMMQGHLSNREAREMMEVEGLSSLGAQLSAERRRLRQA